MNPPAAELPEQVDGTPGPVVALVPWGPGEWAVAVQPGSSAADLYRALEEMPAEAEFSDAFGDVDVLLVYRLPPDPPSRRELVTLRGSALEAPEPDPKRARWMTRGERLAFRAGYREALDTVRVFVSRLAGGGPPAGGEFPLEVSPPD